MPPGDTKGPPERLSVLKMNHHSEDLHKKFCSLMMLLTLATAINNRGHPVHPRPYRMPLDRNLQTDEKVLNAIATLLVQDAEVVAVSACNPFSHDPASGQQGGYQVWAVQQGPQVNYPASHSPDLAMDCIQFGFNGKPFTAIQPFYHRKP